MDAVRGALRRVGALSRIAAGLALLAVIWIATVQGVDRSTQAAEERRVADRRDVAGAFARATSRWLETGRAEADGLAVSLSQRGQRAIEDYIERPGTFGRDVVVFDGDFEVQTGSGRHVGLVGRTPSPCPSVVGDDRLRAVVASIEDGQTSAPGILPAPGFCEDRVMAVARRGSRIVIVEGLVRDLAVRLQAGEMLAPETEIDSSVYLLDPAGRAVGPAGLIEEGLPDRIARLAEDRSSPRTSRQTRDDGGDAEVLIAFHPAADGWSVALEQDAAHFDLDPLQRPSYIVASFLTVALAVVFVLIAFFDIRRQRALRRTDIAKNQFFSIAGHELRTPLTSLRGLSETLSMRWNDLDDARKQAIVERLAPQARRLTRTLERILLAAGINAETYARPRPQPVAIDAIVSTVADRFAAESPLHEFDVRVADDLPEVVGDPQGLEQVLEQVVDNAVKYSPQGGKVRIRAGRSGRVVHVVVDDDGIGLPADSKRIFEPLAQGEAVEGRVHAEGGVGVGLFIARRLLADMGGTIRAQRRKRGGSRFVIALRVARTRSRQSAESAV